MSFHVKVIRTEADYEAALARIQLDRAPSEAQLEAIRANTNVLSATLSTIARRM